MTDSLLKQCGGPALRVGCEKSVLRPLGPDDLGERYLGWLNDPEVSRFSNRRGQTFTFDDMRAYVEAANASPDRLLLGIFLKPDGEHVGNIGLYLFDRANGLAEVSNLLGERSSWGKGIIVDAGKHLIHFGFQRLGVRKFVMGNPAPQRASTFKSTSLGAQLEGRRRRHRRLGNDYVDVLEFGLFADAFYERFPELRDKAPHQPEAAAE
ncbi:MAG: GNAT family N-acetyltransferase [Kiloniellales bacterium]